jgi:hypothetical protein
LKNFLDQMTSHIKGYNSNIRVVHDFGSVFDGLSVMRGTLGFKNLICGADGIKVNDAYDYNHRFAMDLLKSNLPNKWIMNETGLDGSTENIKDLIDQSFEHGAKLVSIVIGHPSIFANTALTSKFAEMANKWIIGNNGNMTTINSTGSLGPYNLSQLLTNSQSYNTAEYNQPKSIILNEDIPEISNCTICDPPSPPAISPMSGTVCASTNQTVTLNSSGCSGTVTWSNGQTGSSLVVSQPNTYTATCTVNNCTSGSSNTAAITQASGCGNAGCSNNGSISYEKWNNIGIGGNISDFRSATNNLTTTPNLTQSLTLFEAPTNIDDQYGVRIKGYVCAPVSGNYTFWIAGDDGCELWLSSDDNPANIQKIAYHNGSTGSQQWNVSSTQQSNTISLVAGQRYYIEALVKEGFGNDNLAVGWQLPNGTLERPIPGNRLIPFGGSSRIGVEENILLLEETSNPVQLYPNPNQGKVNLRYYLAKGEKANLTFVNVGGNIITQKTLVGEGVWKQDQTDLTSQPSGTYSLRFEAEGKLITRKFLIVK